MSTGVQKSKPLQNNEYIVSKQLRRLDFFLNLSAKDAQQYYKLL